MAKITWEKYHADILKLVENMGNYRPDIIAPCMLGGLIPGAIIAKSLGINDVRPIDIERQGDKRCLAYDAQGDTDGKKLLLVEDDLPTGRGPLVVKELFEQRGAEVKIASIYVTSATQKIADFYTEICEEPDYPWKGFHSGNRLRRQ